MRSFNLTIACIALFIVAALPLVHSLQRNSDAYRPRLELEDRILYMPDGDYLGPACLGQEDLVADLIWIRAILLFGTKHDVAPDDRWNLWLYYMLDLVTDLDENFMPAYKYGALMLRLSPRWTEASNLLMAKGMRSNPDEWYLPFAIGWNYFDKGEVERGATFVQQASTLPEAPFYLSNLAATMLNESQQQEAALAFLEAEYEIALDERRRNVLFVKIQETYFEIAARDLGRARESYRADTGLEAADLEDLVPRYVQHIPDDPYAVFVDEPSQCGLQIDPLDRSVTSACLQTALRNIRVRYQVGAAR